MAPSPVRTNVDACPDLETLAAYIDGQLTERERATIAEHLTGCETCFFVFSETAQTRLIDTSREATQESGPSKPKERRITAAIAWSTAAGLAAAASLVFAVATRFAVPRDAESAALKALVASVGTERTLEPRVTGGFAHGPLHTVRGTALAPAVSPDVRIAAAQLEKAANRASAEGLRESGIAALVTGDLDRAVAALESAAAKKPGDAKIDCDLAAAYLARGATGSHADDFSKGLVAANRAVNANRTLPEALFDRALALERLSLNNDARDAWRAYLVVDNQSGWADEARAHLRIIEEGR